MKTSDAKAVTGARAKFPKTDGGDAEARKAFDALVETAKGNGWKVAAVSASRNAFDKIPAPPAAKPAAAAAPKKVK